MRGLVVAGVLVSSSVLLVGLGACGGSSGDGIPNPAASGGTTSSGASTSSGSTSSGGTTTSSGGTTTSSSSGNPDGGGSSSGNGDGGVATTFNLRFAYLGVPIASGGNAQPIDFCIKTATRTEGPIMEKLGSAPGINVGQVSARFHAPAGVPFTLFVVGAATNTCPTILPIDTLTIDVPPQLPDSRATIGRLPLAGAGALKLYADEGVAAGTGRANARLIHAATGIDGTVTLEGANGLAAELFRNVPFGGVTPPTILGTSPNGYRTFQPFTNRQAQLKRDADQAVVSAGALSMKAAAVFSFFTYGHYKNGGGTLQLLGCVDEEMQGAFTNCASAGWVEQL